MRKILKMIALSLCMCILCGVFASCTTEDSEEDSNTFTYSDLVELCSDTGRKFFDGYKTRDISVMDEYISNDYKSSFNSACNDYYEQLDKKVWLSPFFENFLAGSQVIAGSVTTSGDVCNVEFSVVLSDYSSSFRNWLLLYKTKLSFIVDTDNREAYIINPEVIFDMYKDMTNDYTTHVAASLLHIDDDFDASNYYYDEELNIYVPRTDYGDRVTPSNNSVTNADTSASSTTESAGTEPSASSAGNATGGGFGDVTEET